MDKNHYMYVRGKRIYLKVFYDVSRDAATWKYFLSLPGCKAFDNKSYSHSFVYVSFDEVDKHVNSLNGNYKGLLCYIANFIEFYSRLV